MFVPGRPFQPSLMFASKVKVYPRRVGFWPYPPNIRLDWKGQTAGSTVAYYEHS